MRFLLSAAAIVVSVAVLALLQWTTPTYALLTGPLETHGRQTASVSGGPFDVKVNRVLVAKTIAFNLFGRPVERQSDGVWVVVAGEMHADWQTMRIGSVGLKGASGRFYVQSTRVNGLKPLLADKDLQPGLTFKGIFVFEMPEQDASALTLVLSRQMDPRLDSEVHVRLDPAGIERKDRLEIRDDGV